MAAWASYACMDRLTLVNLGKHLCFTLVQPFGNDFFTDMLKYRRLRVALCWGAWFVDSPTCLPNTYYRAWIFNKKIVLTFFFCTSDSHRRPLRYGRHNRAWTISSARIKQQELDRDGTGYWAGDWQLQLHMAQCVEGVVASAGVFPLNFWLAVCG